LGVADPTTEIWKDNLNKCRCKKARIFIPIDWSGEGNAACERPASLPADAPDPPMIKGVTIN